MRAVCVVVSRIGPFARPAAALLRVSPVPAPGVPVGSWSPPGGLPGGL